MFKALASALASGLSLLDTQESRKYQDAVIDIRRRYYEEDNKERPDMGKLDTLEFELRNISQGFSAEVSKQNTKNLHG